MTGRRHLRIGLLTACAVATAAATSSAAIRRAPAPAPIRLVSPGKGNVYPANVGAEGISADGSQVFFYADDPSGVLTGRKGGGLYVHDFRTGKTTLVSVDEGGHLLQVDPTTLQVSSDGRYAAFVSGTAGVQCSSGCSPGIDWPAVYVVDRTTHRVQIASVLPSGEVAQPSGHALAQPPIFGMSADGRYVVFTYQDSLGVNFAQDLSGAAYVRDLVTGTTTELPRPTDSYGEAEILDANGGRGIALSADGRYVAFAAFDNSRAVDHVYVLDRSTGQETQVGDATRDDHYPSLSDDGRYLLYESVDRSTNEGELDLLDRSTGAVVRVDQGADGKPTGESGTLSGDGRHVLLSDGLYRDLSKPAAQVVDVTSKCAAKSPGIAVLSANGRWVAFDDGGDLRANATNGFEDAVYERDMDAKCVPLGKRK